MKRNTRVIITKVLLAALWVGFAVGRGHGPVFAGEASMAAPEGSASDNTVSGGQVSDNEVPSLSIRVAEEYEREMLLHIHAVDEGSGVALIQADNDRVGIRKTLYRPSRMEESQLEKSVNTTLWINTNGCYNIYVYDGKGNGAARAVSISSLDSGDVAHFRDIAFRNSMNARGAPAEGTLYAGFFREGSLGSQSYDISRGKAGNNDNDSYDTGRWRKLIRPKGELKDKVWSEKKSSSADPSGDELHPSLFRDDVMPDSSSGTSDPSSWKLSDVMGARKASLSGNDIPSKGQSSSPGLLLMMLFPGAGLITMLIMIFRKRE